MLFAHTGDWTIKEEVDSLNLSLLKFNYPFSVFFEVFDPSIQISNQDVAS